MRNCWPTHTACTAASASASSASRDWPASADLARNPPSPPNTSGECPRGTVARRHSFPSAAWTGVDAMDSSRPVTLLGRLEFQFLKPYRLPIGLCLLGLFVQSILLLPIPLLQ